MKPAVDIQGGPLKAEPGWQGFGNPSESLTYLVLVVSLPFVLSWVANGTRGSLLIVILGHSSVHWGLLVAATWHG